MKSVLAILFIAGFVSATSIKPYDRWACYFPSSTPTGAFKGTIVNIDYDLFASKGKATVYADCPTCKIKPREFAVERVSSQNTLIYKSFTDLYLQIEWTPMSKPHMPYTSFLGGISHGTCLAR